MAKWHHALLTQHIRPMFHFGSGSVHGPTQGLCDHPTHPQGIMPGSLNYGTLEGLRWGQVGDWYRIGENPEIKTCLITTSQNFRTII